MLPGKGLFRHVLQYGVNCIHDISASLSNIMECYDRNNCTCSEHQYTCVTKVDLGSQQYGTEQRLSL